MISLQGDLPEGWEVKKLGEVCDLINGGTPKTNIKEYWDGDIRWITPADLGKLSDIAVYETPRKITELGLQKSSAKLFPKDSVILSTRAPIGHLAINKLPMSTNQGCRGIVPSNKINVLFLYYFLKNNIELLNSLGTGATFKELSTKALSNVGIPLPPIVDQQRIVSILDQVFSAIEKAKENTKKNLKNSKELFNNYLQGLFENGDWEKRRLSEICYLSAGGDVPKDDFSKVKTKNQYVPIFANGEKNNGLYGYTSIAKIMKPSITVSARGTIGYSVKRLQPFFPVVRLIVVTPINLNILDLNYLDYAIKTISFKHTGSSIPQLTIPMIKDYEIFLPTLAKQQIIVNQLDTLQNENTKLETMYQQKLNNLEELKKSILQKAFSGEL